MRSIAAVHLCVRERDSQRNLYVVSLKEIKVIKGVSFCPGVHKGIQSMLNGRSTFRLLM